MIRYYQLMECVELRYQTWAISVWFMNGKYSLGVKYTLICIYSCKRAASNFGTKDNRNRQDTKYECRFIIADCMHT